VSQLHQRPGRRTLHQPEVSGGIGRKSALGFIEHPAAMLASALQSTVEVGTLEQRLGHREHVPDDESVTGPHAPRRAGQRGSRDLRAVEPHHDLRRHQPFRPGRRSACTFPEAMNRTIRSDATPAIPSSYGRSAGGLLSALA
jgi:hypothetical protein